MRNAFWLAVIAGALVSIVTGYVRGLQAQPPPVAQLRRSAAQAVAANVPPGLVSERGSEMDDAFARDDVVVDRMRPGQSQWQPERLELVVGVCGDSVAVDSEFLRLGVPATFVVDPHAAQAAAFAGLARSNGDAVFVQADVPPGPDTLAAWRRTIGPFAGVASRSAAGMVLALRGTGLAYFDERGDDANEQSFATQGVPLIRRDVTADNHGGNGYVQFMLERAAVMSRRAGPVVVFVRPLPSTLAAVRAFVASHDARMIALQ